MKLLEEMQNSEHTLSSQRVHNGAIEHIKDCWKRGMTIKQMAVAGVAIAILIAIVMVFIV